MVIINDFNDLIRKRKRKIKTVKATKNFLVGMGIVAAAIGILLISKLKKRSVNMKRENSNNVEKIKNTIEAETETMKDSVAHVNIEIDKAIKDVHKKSDNIKEDIKDGLYKTKKDIHKTVKNVSKELDNL